MRLKTRTACSLLPLEASSPAAGKHGVDAIPPARQIARKGSEPRKHGDQRDIPKPQDFCFAWNDEAGMHTFKGRAAGVKRRRWSLLQWNRPVPNGSRSSKRPI